MKKLTVFISILLSIVCVMTSVYAAESFSVTAQSNKSEVSKNEEFTMEFSLTNMQVGEGIISVGASLEYDKASLEVVSTEGQNKWNMLYNDAQGMILLESNSLIKDNGALCKVTFKVKENNKQNLTIKLKNITAAGGGNEITATNVEKAIVIKQDTPNNGGNNSGNNNGDNSANSNNNNNANVNNKPNTTTSTNEKNQSASTTIEKKTSSVSIPKAGVNDTIIFALIGVATVSAIIFFVKGKM